MSNSSETPTSVLAAIVAIGGSALTLFGLFFESMELMLLPTTPNAPRAPAL
jgi:hypothetical protein